MLLKGFSWTDSFTISRILEYKSFEKLWVIYDYFCKFRKFMCPSKTGAYSDDWFYSDDLIGWSQMSAILDSQSVVSCAVRSKQHVYGQNMWYLAVIIVMATRSVFVLATVVSIRDKFCYPCCTQCHKKVHTREDETTWVFLVNKA